MGGRGKVASHLLGVVIFITCLAVPVVAQDTVTISISRIAGTIELCHPMETSGNWIAAKEGQEIGNGWEIRTGSASKVELLLPRDSTVILREKSVLYIDWLLMNGSANLRTDHGGLLVDIKQALSPGSEFQIKTPSALAVVRGTKFGVVSLREGNVAFYGYRGKVEVVNDLGTQLLTAGLTVDVKSGMPPQPPQLSGTDAAAFLAGAESETGYRRTSGESAALIAELGQMERTLDETASKLGQQEADWRRFASKDKQASLVYTYASTKGLRAKLDQQGAKFQQLLGRTDAGGLWTGSGALSARKATVGNYAAQVQQKFAALYERFEQFEQTAQPAIQGKSGLLTKLDAARPAGQETTWKLVDSDGDGVSDVDETALGLDPEVANTTPGFLVLGGPADGAQLDYPAADCIWFEFSPLETSLVTRYRLVLECGDKVWQRTNIGARTKVPLGPLLGPEGMFANSADGNGGIAITWYVLAEIDSEQLLHRLASARPDCPALHAPALASAKRSLRIMTPRQQAVVVLDLTAMNGERPRVGDKLLVEGRISEVNALGRWRVDVACDPALMRLVAGGKGALGRGASSYFAAQDNGVIVVTGAVPTDSAGISGSGALFQLEFVACEPGKLEVLVQGLDLCDILGREISANPGNKVDARVLPARPAPVKAQKPGGYRGNS